MKRHFRYSLFGLFWLTALAAICAAWVVFMSASLEYRQTRDVHAFTHAISELSPRAKRAEVESKLGRPNVALTRAFLEICLGRSISEDSYNRDFTVYEVVGQNGHVSFRVLFFQNGELQRVYVVHEPAIRSFAR